MNVLTQLLVWELLSLLTAMDLAKELVWELLELTSWSCKNLDCRLGLLDMNHEFLQ